jgi:myo-inositol 2-dehydrogenase / D-chiro-inositol 1-dehydrogenase
LWNRKGKLFYDHDGKNDPDPYQAEHDELYAAVAAGIYQYADAEHAAKSTMTAILGRMAAYSGKEIKWEEAINSPISLAPDKISWNVNPKVMPDANGNYPFAIPGKTTAF